MVFGFDVPVKTLGCDCGSGSKVSCSPSRLAVLGKLNNFVKEWIAEISELKVGAAAVHLKTTRHRVVGPHGPHCLSCVSRTFLHPPSAASGARSSRSARTDSEFTPKVRLTLRLHVSHVPVDSTISRCDGLRGAAGDERDSL